MQSNAHAATRWVPALFLSLGLLLTATPGRAELLPSWRDGQAKRTIVDFVARVTQEGGPDFVAREALSSGGDWGRYLRRVGATPGALLVLLVRPDGLATSRIASRLAREAGVRVARLPLPGEGELDWSLIRKLEAAR